MIRAHPTISAPAIRCSASGKVKSADRSSVSGCSRHVRAVPCVHLAVFRKLDGRASLAVQPTVDVHADPPRSVGADHGALTGRPPAARVLELDEPFSRLAGLGTALSAPLDDATPEAATGRREPPPRSA